MFTRRDFVGFGAMALASGCGKEPQPAAAEPFDEQTLFAGGTDGYHTYRIPSLLTTPKGTVLAFCEGRKEGSGDSGDIAMLVKRSEDGGRTWSAQSVVWADPGNTCGNPCPVVDRRNGRILLPMTWNLGADGGRELHAGTGKGPRKVYLTWSDDEGKTWAPAREITDQAKAPDWWWYATGPGVSIQIERGPRAGRIVVPANHSSEKDGYAAHSLISDDGGESWRFSAPIAPACNESQAVELADGRLCMNMRSQSFTNEERTGYRSVAFSGDGGETWTPPEFDAHLGDPAVQASIIRYSWPDEPGGGRLLFSNPSPPISPERGERVRMTVRMSLDDGKTWPVSRLIFEGRSAYSSLTRLPDGSVGLLYERGEARYSDEICLARLSLGWLES